ncbi:MAG TPA: beta-N-acetylhexosaminidase [Burkholderiaceae bacterium]|nr:beta-N-acetylhexosaminidase [Burkholderiaceae bacterium]
MTNAVVHPGRLVMVNIEGTTLGAAQATFLREQHIRAVCLFRHNLGSEAEVRQLTRELREVLGDDALIAIDQEGGSVVRATFLPQPPAAMALGACGDAALAESVGEAVGRGIRSLGFNWDFAPVLDVNNNPANPVIAERSFAEDPHEVARLAGAWMRGALRAGIACCVKHFPGHGDTHVDSHLALPIVDKPLAALRALEFVPFDLLSRDAPAMMTAHIVYPQLDPEHPATLSRKVLGELLRRDWGYDGVVITDSLVMRAIHERYGHDRAAVLALQAGADMVMALGSQAEQLAAVQAIAAARERRALTEAQLQAANTRLDALARRYPAAAGDYAAAQREADDALMRTAWARGLTGIGAGLRRPQRVEPLRVYTQRSVPSDGVSEAGPSGAQVASLFAGFADVEVVQVGDLRLLNWDSVPRDGRRTVLVSNHRDRYDAASHAWRPDLHLALWNPFQVLDIAAPAVVTWGYAEGALAALRDWLEGHGALPGHAPVHLTPAVA